jgi:signal transduction histidine kinase
VSTVSHRIPDAWADPLLGATLLIICEAEVIGVADGRGTWSLAALIEAAALTVPIAWRRRAPLAVACCVMASVVALAAALPEFTSLISPMFALFVPPYSVAAHERRPKALAGLAICLTGAIVVNILHSGGLSSIVFSTVAVGASWAVGRALRSRRELARALHLTTDRLIAGEDGRKRLAVADERTRIARELDAAVARSISQMVVQSDAARRLLETDRARAEVAMAALEDAGRETLAEMRRILGVLRRIDAVQVLVPQPGVGQIPALVEHACEGGRQAALRVEGDPGPLPASVDISMYRILQDALTVANAGAMEIVLRFGADDLALDVVADGTIAAWPTTAMCERAALCDGTLDVLPYAGTRTRIQVRMPRVFDGALA